MEEYPPGQRTHSGGEYHPTIIDFDPLFEHVIWINPDSKEIMNQGPYSPIRQGWMTKVRTNFYRLTPLGLAAAERLKGRVGETVGTARASQNVFDSLAKYIEHRAFRDYCRDPEEPRTWLGAAAFLGITKNEPRELADRICAAENTIKQASAWMDHERRDTIRRGPVGGSITIRRLDVERLQNFSTCYNRGSNFKWARFERNRDRPDQNIEKGSKRGLLVAQLAYLLSLKTMNTKARLGVRSGCDAGAKM